MKQIMLIAVLCLSGILAHAQDGGRWGWGRPGPGRGGPGYPGRPGPGYPGPGRGGGGWGGNVQCSATDSGWEEHWGGHGSCGECLQIHGNCTETCSRSYNVCQAEGIDQSGRRFTTEGRGEIRYQAEDDAMRACYYYRYQNCRIVSCNQNNETVSRRSCR
ncbi:MAG TPA: hypothetical protein VIG33_10230 [Pseudobdellovibrionaceae bacterium]